MQRTTAQSNSNNNNASSTKQQAQNTTATNQTVSAQQQNNLSATNSSANAASGSVGSAAQTSAASHHHANVANNQVNAAAAAQVAIERTIHFNQGQAIVWQIKFILNQISSKKALNQASIEIESLSAKFGKDFDKYLLKELIEQIDLITISNDLKDPVKGQKDKNEPLKVSLLVQEFARCSQKADFLQYFGEIAQQGGFSERLGDFLAELTRRLKLSQTQQILVALSLVESSREEASNEAIKFLKQKLLDYYHQGRPEPIPDYALHRLIFLYSTHPEMNQDENRDNIQQYLIDSNALKASSHISLRGALQQDLMFANASIDEPSICLTKEGNGIDNLDKSYRMLEPWQLLIDLGHYSSYNYNYLLKILEDFKDINERTMARTLLNLAINHTGCDDQASKIVQNTFEANKKGDSTLLRKEIADKKNQITWSVDNLSRAFRELFSHLNWHKVFEALCEIPDEISLDAKAFATFLQITNKSKPQNLPYPLLLILQTQWASPLLQLSFIENSIQFYIEKKEKSIYFNKAGERRQEYIEELTGIKEKVSTEFLHVWLSVDLVERLLVLSDSHYFQRVRQLFEAPLKQVPEYLLLTLSLCKLTKGCLMIDELLSILLPQFLGNHINSILVLQALWRNNQALMIRAICELCRHDQRIMNLSRVLDITQEVKESLMPIVDCEDYYFAVNLAILAGKRDFLHYDVWLQRRIGDVGTPFIKALLKYIKEHIITPINEFQQRKPTGTGNAAQQQQELADQFELQKQQVLERSHLSKEKLCITIENLQNLQNQHNPLIKPETRDQIKEVVLKLSEYFPSQFGATQNSEEIDNAANDYFQKVFSAEPHQVDQKISELIETMHKFRFNDVKKDQEIYACMIHSLFDEYRFLHKYPNQYLEKIAKLFGAIIKNRIMDGALQEIALKFVLEAFRREGKRMKFGIIVIRHILDMLPQFPQFFEGIYEHRHNIQSTDAPLIKEIEDLYEKAKTSRTRAQSGMTEEPSKMIDDGLSSKYKSSISSISNESFDEKLKEEVKDGRIEKGGKESAALPSMPKINENEFRNTLQTVQATSTTQPQVSSQPKGKDVKSNQPQKVSITDSNVVKGGTLPPSSTQAPVFNPTYKVRAAANTNAQDINASQPVFTQGQLLNAQTISAQAAEIVAQASSQASITQPNILATSLTTTSSQGLNPSSQAFSRKPNTALGATASSSGLLPASQILQNSILIGGGGGVGPAPSSAFQPNPLQQQQQQTVVQPIQQTGSSLGNAGPINIMNARPFRPAVMRSPPPPANVLPVFNQQTYQMQLNIETKLQKALNENVKVKLEDVIEESNMAGPSESQQEEFKFIGNSVGRNNFSQKLDQAKAIISQNPSANLSWFIHFILTKRLQSTNLFSLYIDMIKQIGQKDSITQTILQAVEIFKKCMLIDEEILNRVAQRPQGQISLIKQYLLNLGSFLGQLTIAGNRPIYSKELDIKQLLVEGFQSEKMKYVILFVCRILRECSKSSIFKHQNPWVRANLEILREVYEWALSNNNQNYQHNDVIMEIDSLFKSFGQLNINDIKHTGFLQASVTQQYNTPSQQAELNHMINKSKIIPAVQAPVQPAPSQHEFGRAPSVSPSPNLQMMNGLVMFQNNNGQQPQRMMTPGQQSEYELQRQQLINNINKIFPKIVLSPEFQSMLGFSIPQQKSGSTVSCLQPQQDQNLRKIVADAVDQSIVEILAPVVDRSVTIALITTRELVLKDFAFDPDFNKILKAADLIVQNLAGSLALVTCREPLKMQLTTNLKKSLQQQLNPSLFLQDINDTQIQFPQLTDTLIQDLAQQASKDNLELGCKLIKKAVIQKALAKVREDQQITAAIKQRQNVTNAQEFKKLAMDETLMQQFADLPQQLKPSSDGLTEPQFQVYEDFSRLSNNNSNSNNYASSNTTNSAFGNANSSNNANGNAAGSSDLSGDVAAVNDDIESYLKQYDSLQAFDKKFETYLAAKLNQMSTKQNESSIQDQIKKLVKYCENLFSSVCERLVQQQINQQLQGNVVKILDFLGFVTQNLKYGEANSESLQMRLTQQFLSLDSSYVHNTSLTLTLMKRGILSASKWDSQIAQFVRESQPFNSSNSLTKEIKDLFTFLREFFETAISQQAENNTQQNVGKALSYQNFPNVMLVIQKFSETDVQVSQFFSLLLQDYRLSTLWTKEILRDYFNEWAVFSFEEACNPIRQEQEVNRFISNLKQQGLYKDQKAMQKFFKTMIQLSVEKALYYSDGVTKRPADRLVYRYIQSFLILLVVLLKMFTTPGDAMNKNEFFALVFDAIYQVIEEDHRINRGDFNQKPYYRILINLLRVVNDPTTFNHQKTFLQVQFSVADLFNKLNPKEFPAFSFAWLELISNRQFMPNFLQSVGAQSQSQPGAQQQNLTQQQRKSSIPQIQTVDNTYYQKQLKYKELILHLFTFLKNNMLVGQPLSEPLAKFYEATLRVVLVIKNDYPEFLCDFHFNFVNSLPEHCVQLRNIILSAQPRNIPCIDPFSKNLKVDTLNEINLAPRSQSNYENYLTFMNLREDLERYLRSRDKNLIQVIADKMMQSEEIINGRKRINSSIFNAVALFIQNYAHYNKSKQQAQKECYDMLKQILVILNSETRQCLLNSIVNELRYVNAHTYFYSWMVIFLFNDIDEGVQEQITRILIERLQTHEPHPWGLCITFRELLQNPKYAFSKKSFVVRNQAVIEQLMQTKLSNFYQFWVNNKQMNQVGMPQQQIQPGMMIQPGAAQLQQHQNQHNNASGDHL